MAHEEHHCSARVEIVRDITELKGKCDTQEYEISTLRTDVENLKTETKLIHDLNENIAGMVVGLQYMKDGIEDIKVTQAKIKTDVSDLSGKVNDLENRPARETQARFKDIRDKVIISVVASGLGALLAALIALAL